MKHAKATLMNWNKEKLADQVLFLEQNIENLKWSFEVQYQNCINIIKDMNLLNDTFKKQKSSMKGNDK